MYRCPMCLADKSKLERIEQKINEYRSPIDRDTYKDKVFDHKDTLKIKCTNCGFEGYSENEFYYSHYQCPDCGYQECFHGHGQAVVETVIDGDGEYYWDYEQNLTVQGGIQYETLEYCRCRRKGKPEEFEVK